MLPLRRISTFLLLWSCFGVCCRPLAGQVLARPGWAGSGVTPEVWWRRAVFYRIDPARFQDSDGNGIGDFKGVMQRLDYLQSLGVDALVLDGGVDTDAEGLGDLIGEASRHHLRLLLTVTPAMQAGPREALLAAVHGWVGAGAAGVWLPKPVSAAHPETATGDAQYAALVAALTDLLHGLPGERVLLDDPAPQRVETAPPPAHVRHRTHPGLFGGASVGQLTTVVALPVQPPAAAALRQSLKAVAEDTSPTATPLLRFAEDPATASPDAIVAATALLASRGAAVFDFGDEIGLASYAPARAHDGAAAALPVMQWTPANVQEAAPAPIERRGPPPLGPDGATPFGAYHPYVKPPPGSPTGAVPGRPRTTADANTPAALPNPNTLPGFTTAALPVSPLDGAAVNTITEDRDPNSVLNAYRQLIALHGANAALRNGSQYVLNQDAKDALVWVRRAPAGSRTGADVVVAANLGAQPVSLSLDADLQGLGMRPGMLRPLFVSSPTPLTGETTAALQLPGHAVFIGEVLHAGAQASGPALRTRRSARRR